MGEFFYVQCSGVFSKPSLFDVKKSLLLNIGQTKRRLVSTSSARSQFKLDGKRRKLDPNRPAPHTLRNRKTLTYLAIALIATVAAPQVPQVHKYPNSLIEIRYQSEITIFHRSGHQQDDRL